MARIIYPESFLSQSELFLLINEKITNDGAASPLLPFLLEQDIVLAHDNNHRLNAAGFEKERQKLARESENFRQQRNNLFKPVLKRTRGYFQFLKKFYRNNAKAISLWGAPITATGRIKYPARFLQLSAMTETLAAKHAAYAPGTSPLDAYLNQHGYSIATDQAAVGNAMARHHLAEASSKASEHATQNRNNTWNPVLGHMRSIGAFLMALHKHNPKELGNYGFVVDHSPRAPRQVVSKVLLLSKKTLNAVIIGGTFKNTGPVPLTVYKGRTTSTAGTIISAGEMLTIAKGHSTITVVNHSSTTTGVFSVLRSK